MLTEQKLWELIQLRLGLPYTFFELSYGEVIDYLKSYTLIEFSRYVPFYAQLVAYPDTTNQYSSISGRVYVIQVPDGLQILGILNVLSSTSNYFVNGFPFAPITTGYNRAIDVLLRGQYAKLGASLSPYVDFTWRFRAPNLLFITPPQGFSSNEPLTVEAYLTHPSFMTIPAKFQKEFVDLCIADVKLLLGEIRSRYQSIQTFFGQIDLQADQLKSEGEQLRQQVLERLQTLPPYKSIKIAPGLL